MVPLMTRAHLELLAQVAFSRTLLAFDYDGTLAPIVSNRDEARVRPETLMRLKQVCELYPCAVISGRTRRDLMKRLGAAKLKYVLGNYGFELDAQGSAFERPVAEVLPHLKRALAGIPGLEIEDKRLSIAIHYRRNRRKREARSAIARAALGLPVQMRSIPGKMVVNLVPAQAPSKGDALLDLRARAEADVALYVGDDLSDEDVFCLDAPGQVLGVRVGKSARTSALYYLRDQLELDVLLQTLIELRGSKQTLIAAR